MNLPRHLIDEYWLTVQNVLTKQYDLTASQAWEEISAYRDQMRTHGAEEVIYHSNPADTATTLANAFRHGGFRKVVLESEEHTAIGVRR